jgi:hypothetical protein
MDLLSEKVYVSGLTSLWPEITCITNLPREERKYQRRLAERRPLLPENVLETL